MTTLIEVIVIVALCTPYAVALGALADRMSGMLAE